jgi:hypothetical protein
VIGLLVVLVLVFLLVLVIWPAMVAGTSGKRRNMENAWMYGFALSWVGVWVVNSRPLPEPAPVVSPYRAGAPQPQIKTCPRCAETVKAAARVCRFCGHSFVDSNAAEHLESS